MVGEVLEEGRERESFPLLLFILGGEILFCYFYSFGRGRSSAFVFFHWVEESFFPASHIWYRGIFFHLGEGISSLFLF